MLAYNVPLMFWLEALQYSVHILNITPRQSLDGDTPHYRVFGVIPDMTNIYPFFCPGIYHVSEEERTKGFIAARAVECRYLGYVAGSFSIWVPSKHSILSRKDCRFEESRDLSLDNESEMQELLRSYPDLLKDFKGNEPLARDMPDFFDFVLPDDRTIPAATVYQLSSSTIGNHSPSLNNSNFNIPAQPVDLQYVASTISFFVFLYSRQCNIVCCRTNSNSTSE